MHPHEDARNGLSGPLDLIPLCLLVQWGENLQTNNKQFSGYKLGVLCMIQLNVDTIYLEIVTDFTD